MENKENPALVTDAVVDKINELVAEHKAKGETTAIMTTSNMANRYHADHIILLGEQASGDTVAAHLYAALRECDDTGIYSESFNRDDLGGAIMNRLLKAAGHRVVQV